MLVCLYGLFLKFVVLYRDHRVENSVSKLKSNIVWNVQGKGFSKLFKCCFVFLSFIHRKCHLCSYSPLTTLFYFYNWPTQAKEICIICIRRIEDEWIVILSKSVASIKPVRIFVYTWRLFRSQDWLQRSLSGPHPRSFMKKRREKALPYHEEKPVVWLLMYLHLLPFIFLNADRQTFNRFCKNR